MIKKVRLTESDLAKVVRRIIKEQNSLPHPVEISMWQQMLSNVEGDGVETVQYIPNKKLVINAFGNLYTITLTKAPK